MKNLFIKFCLLIPIVFVNPFRADCQIGWIVNGNALPENTYRYLGAGSCTEVRIITDSIEMMSYKPGCMTGAGGIITVSNTDLFDLDGVTDVDWSEVKSFRMGGVVVTTDTGTAKYCELKTTSLSGMKGFKMKSAGSSTVPALFTEVTSTSASNIIALKTKSTPQQGYGYGLNAVGGCYGVYGKGDGGPFSASNVYGVYGYSSGIMGTGTRVGVYGKAELANTAFGVYGAADSTSAIITRAGYFSGSLEYTGSLIGPSDEKLKENIRSFSGALDRLGTLEVKTYSFKPEYAFMHFSKGKQIGIMADNLMQSFPELVSSSVHPAEYDPETGKEISREVSYKGVNYLGLVPVLVQGIKEQQEQINMLKKSNEELDNLKKENELLKNRLDALEARISSPNRKETGQNGSSRPYLEQNVPNPFSDKTIIRYFIPEGSGRCSIAVYTADHSLVKSIAVEGYGSGQAEVQAGTLKSGNYSCELLINQVVVDSKQMIIIR